MGIAIQSTFFDDTLAQWHPPEDFPRLEGLVAIDLETKDPLFSTHGPGWFTDQGFITGVSLATETWQAYYPVRHSSGNLPESMVFNWLRDELKNPNLEIAMYNRQYDEGWLTNPKYNIKIAGKIFDGMGAMPLIDENRFSYQLDRVAKDILGETKAGNGRMSNLGSLADALKMGGKSSKKYGPGLKDPKKIMDELPASLVGPYAEQDARLTYNLVGPLKKLIDQDDLHQIFDLETRLQPVLLEMRRRGVRVDEEKAHALAKELQTKVDACVHEVHKITGHWIEPMNAASIAKMFDSVGVKYGTTAGKTPQPSITKELLKKVEHPTGQLILRARKYATAKGTFVEGCVLNHVINGRIHAQFHPLKKDDDAGAGGAVTGRFSSSDPSLQNLPALDPDVPLKNEIGLMVRGLFVPEVGEQWAAPDYSGQEPRLATHFAALLSKGPDRYKVKGVELFVNAYLEDPKMKFHKKGAEICGLGYKAAKNMTLGKMYGMGGAKMCRDLGLPTKWIKNRQGIDIEVAGDEGQKVFDKYNEFMPWVKGLADIAMKRAESRGWIRTLLGRRRRFEPQHKGGAFSYKALNCLIQGSAADQMKMAMIHLFERQGVIPLVTVHDELGLSVPDVETGRRYQQVMIDCVQLLIPNAMDLEIGPSWGESALKAA